MQIHEAKWLICKQKMRIYEAKCKTILILFYGMHLQGRNRACPVLSSYKINTQYTAYRFLLTYNL